MLRHMARLLHSCVVKPLSASRHDDLPSRYCNCPGPSPSASIPHSTTSKSLVSCDTLLGTVTHLTVCPWTTTPPKSMKISTVQVGSTYPGGTLPPAQTAIASCVPNKCGSQPALQGSYVRALARGFCRRAIKERSRLGPGTGNINRLITCNDGCVKELSQASLK